MSLSIFQKPNTKKTSFTSSADVSLFTLCDDEIYSIFLFCSKADNLSLGLTCKRFHSISKCNEVWKVLLRSSEETQKLNNMLKRAKKMKVFSTDFENVEAIIASLQSPPSRLSQLHPPASSEFITLQQQQQQQHQPRSRNDEPSLMMHGGEKLAIMPAPAASTSTTQNLLEPGMAVDSSSISIIDSNAVASANFSSLFANNSEMSNTLVGFSSSSSESQPAITAATIESEPQSQYQLQSSYSSYEYSLQQQQQPNEYSCIEPQSSQSHSTLAPDPVAAEIELQSTEQEPIEVGEMDDIALKSNYIHLIKKTSFKLIKETEKKRIADRNKWLNKVDIAIVSGIIGTLVIILLASFNASIYWGITFEETLNQAATNSKSNMFLMVPYAFFAYLAAPVYIIMLIVACCIAGGYPLINHWCCPIKPKSKQKRKVLVRYAESISNEFNPSANCSFSGALVPRDEATISMTKSKNGVEIPSTYLSELLFTKDESDNSRSILCPVCPEVRFRRLNSNKLLELPRCIALKLFASFLWFPLFLILIGVKIFGFYSTPVWRFVFIPMYIVWFIALAVLLLDFFRFSILIYKKKKEKKPFIVDTEILQLSISYASVKTIAIGVLFLLFLIEGILASVFLLLTSLKADGVLPYISNDALFGILYTTFGVFPFFVAGSRFYYTLFFQLQSKSGQSPVLAPVAAPAPVPTAAATAVAAPDATPVPAAPTMRTKINWKLELAIGILLFMVGLAFIFPYVVCAVLVHLKLQGLIAVSFSLISCSFLFAFLAVIAFVGLLAIVCFCLLGAWETFQTGNRTFTTCLMNCFT